MPISDISRFGGLQANIESSLQNLNIIQNQISTGKKLTTYSDDPAGASESLVLRSALLANKQYQRNATSATTFLSASGSALSSATTIIQAARTIAVQGANSTQTPSSFAALSSQVDGIVGQLTTIANSKIGAKYLFGGTNTTTAPYDATQTYQGNSQSINSTIGPNTTVALNTPGPTAFGPAFTALQTLKTDLNSGNITAISADIGLVDTALASVTSANASIGARTNEVTAASQQLSLSETQFNDQVASIEDVDLASAYVQLQSAQNVYQASLATTGKAFQYSLADYLPAG